LNEDDEIEAEQKEKKLWKRLNERFSQFSKDLEDLAEKIGVNLKFDIPYTELAFNANTGRSICWMYPTINAIINLTEQPFTIIDMSEVELVHFERV